MNLRSEERFTISVSDHAQFLLANPNEAMKGSFRYSMLLRLSAELKARLDSNEDMLEQISDICSFLTMSVPFGHYLRAESERVKAESLRSYWRIKLSGIVDEYLDDSGMDEPPQEVDAVYSDELRMADFDEGISYLEACDCGFGAKSGYIGLQAFNEADREKFFGREDAVERFSELITAFSSGYLFITGETGAGKSSLLKAGVVPKLREHIENTASKARIVGPFEPGPYPLESLRAALMSAGVESTSDPDDLRKAVFAHPTYLIIDQFEEVETLDHFFGLKVVPEEQTEHLQHRKFLRLLADFMESSVDHSIRLVATVRSQSVSEFENEWKNFSFPEGSTRVEELDSRPVREALEKIVRLPAAGMHLQFEDGLVDLLVAETWADPCGLPLLQFTLRTMWSQARERKTDSLDIKQYDDLGGVYGSLAKIADGLCDRADKAGDSEPFKAIFLSLVCLCRTLSNFGVYANLLSKEELVKSVQARCGASVEPTKIVSQIDLLLKHGLLTEKTVQAQARPELRLRVTHESLFYRWSKLRGWIEQERVERADIVRLETQAGEFFSYLNSRNLFEKYFKDDPPAPDRELDRLLSKSKEMSSAGLSLTARRFQRLDGLLDKRARIRRNRLAALGFFVFVILIFAGIWEGQELIRERVDEAEEQANKKTVNVYQAFGNSMKVWRALESIPPLTFRLRWRDYLDETTVNKGSMTLEAATGLAPARVRKDLILAYWAGKAPLRHASKLNMSAPPKWKVDRKDGFITPDTGQKMETGTEPKSEPFQLDTSLLPSQYSKLRAEPTHLGCAVLGEEGGVLLISNGGRVTSLDTGNPGAAAVSVAAVNGSNSKFPSMVVAGQSDGVMTLFLQDKRGEFKKVWRYRPVSSAISKLYFGTAKFGNSDEVRLCFESLENNQDEVYDIAFKVSIVVPDWKQQKDWTNGDTGMIFHSNTEKDKKTTGMTVTRPTRNVAREDSIEQVPELVGSEVFSFLEIPDYSDYSKGDEFEEKLQQVRPTYLFSAIGDRDGRLKWFEYRKFGASESGGIWESRVGPKIDRWAGAADAYLKPEIENDEITVCVKPLKDESWVFEERLRLIPEKTKSSVQK